jgi:hypothetical protein
MEEEVVVVDKIKLVVEVEVEVVIPRRRYLFQVLVDKRLLILSVPLAPAD